MFRKDWFGLVVLAWGVALSLGQILPASAQDAVDTGNSASADTEITTEVTVMLGMEGAPLALPSLEATVQAPTEAVPAEENAVQSPVVGYRVFLPTVFTENSVDTDNEVSAAYTYWRTIKYETFEGTFPNPGWITYDCGSVTNGVEYWGQAMYLDGAPHSWSAWAAAGNPAPPNKNPNMPGDNYSSHACAWMIYGPFKLNQAHAARMTFRFRNMSELNKDFFSWMATCTGKPYFSGLSHSGDSGGWQSVTLDLGHIPNLGSCVGTSGDVWIAFRFTSDLLFNYKGPFVDDVLIEELRQYP
jgi:hypothetical protein